MSSLENNNCSELRSDLAEVKTLAEEFFDIYEKSLVKKEMADAVEIIDELGHKILRLKNKLEPKWVQQEKIARELMGTQEVLGPAEVKKAFGINIDRKDVPAIPFSEDDLRDARSLGQFLVLRVDKDRYGDPLTINKIQEALIDNGFKEDVHGKISYIINQNVFKMWQYEQVELSWALVAKEEIPESIGKNYLEQLHHLIRYLEREVFAEKTMPEWFQAAKVEFYQYVKNTFNVTNIMEARLALVGSDWEKYAKELTELKISQLAMPTPAEAFYDIYIYCQNNQKKPHEGIHGMTNGLDSNGRIISVGLSDEQGTRIIGNAPGAGRTNMGALFARKK